MLPLAIPIATTLIGSGLSAGQAINASKKRKEAQAAADAAAAKLKAMRYEDTMAGLQVPMMGFEQSAQKQAQREAMQIQALQEAGGAAVLGGTPGLAAMGAEEDLARMAEIDQMEYARNLERARNQQAISNANLEFQAGIQGMELAGAQQAAAQAESDKRAAISGMAQSIGQAGIDIYGMSALYPQKGIKGAPQGTRMITDPKTGLQSSVAPNYAPTTAKTATPPNIYGLQANPNAPGLKQPLTSMGLSTAGLGAPAPTGPISYTGSRMPGTNLGLLSQLPPSMGGSNINARNYFSSVTSPFEQYTTF